MNTNRSAITPFANDIDELLLRAQVIRTRGFEPVVQWFGGEGREPWPVYEPAVDLFFAWASDSPLIDVEYDPEQAGRALASDAQLATAGIGELRAMLTWCVRGEFFSPGHWGSVIESGRFDALMRRFEELLAGEGQRPS